jgi:uncharacterized protein (TIGR00725 family)
MQKPMSVRPVVIAVVGDAALAADDPKASLAERFGTLVADEGWRLLTGGLGGVMEAASRGARASLRCGPGGVIGLLPGTDSGSANPFVDVAIATGLGHGRNIIVAQADAVVAVGGGAGTMAEIAFAWMYRRLILAFRVDGWSGRVADTRIDERVRYPGIADDRVFGVSHAHEAVSLIKARLSSYKHSPPATTNAHMT